MTLVLQRFFRAFLKVVLRAFFEEIVVRGQERIPKEPVRLIVAPNHPNMLMDPLVVSVYLPREGLGFWAKAPLFKGVAGKLLSLLGAVPVQRAKDQPNSDSSSRLDNSALFTHSVNALREGRSLVLFPEGVSYTEAHLMPVKTGCARVVQEYEDKREEGEPKVAILPVGISYVQKDRWRSQVHVEFGEPLFLPEREEKKQIDEETKREEVRQLTAKLEASLRQLTVNASDMETLLDLHLAKRIYTSGRELSLEQHVMLTKRFADFYDKKKDEDDVKSLKDDVRAYRHNLQKLNLEDWQIFLAKEKSAGVEKLRAHLLRKLVIGILTLPVAIFGFLLHVVPFVLSRRLNHATEYTEERSTFKLLVFVFVVPLWYFILSVATAWMFALSLPAFFVLLFLFFPIVGFAIIFFVQNERHTLKAFFSLVWLGLLLRNSSALLTQLIADRDRISSLLSLQVSAYLTSTHSAPILSDLARKADLTKTYGMIGI